MKIWTNSGSVLEYSFEKCHILYPFAFGYLSTFLQIIFTHILAQFSLIMLVSNTKIWDDKKDKTKHLNSMRSLFCSVPIPGFEAAITSIYLSTSCQLPYCALLASQTVHSYLMIKKGKKCFHVHLPS